MPTFVAWKLKSRSEVDYTYFMQISQVPPREEKIIIDKMVDWNIAGETAGILLFSRRFKNDAAWLKWVRKFEHPVSEIDDDGKEKRKFVYHKSEYIPQIPKVRKERVCSICKEAGHDARRCNEINKTRSQVYGF